MKKFAFYLCLLIAFVSNAQNVEFSKPVSTDAKARYNTIHASDYKKYSVKFYQDDDLYYLMNFETGLSTEKKLKKPLFEDQKGKIINIVIHENYLYEIVRFVKSNLTKKCRIGIIKRSIETFEQVDVVMMPEEFAIFSAEENPVVETYLSETGIYFLSRRQSTSENNYLSFYDFDLNEKWKHKMGFMGEMSVSLQNFDVFEEGNAVLEIHFAETQKGFTFKESIVKPMSVSFVVVRNTGEIEFIAPKLDKEFVFKHNSIFYDFDKDELIGLYFINEISGQLKEKLTGTGYAFMKWGKDGQIISSVKKMFTNSDIYTKEVTDYLKSEGVANHGKPGESLPPLDSKPTIHHLKDGSFIIEYSFIVPETLASNKEYKALGKSNFLYRLSKEGDLQWSRFDLIKDLEENRDISTIYNGTDLYKVGFNLKSGKKSGENSITGLSFQIMNLDNGTYGEKVNVSLPASYLNYNAGFITDRTPKLSINKEHMITLWNQKDKLNVRGEITF